MKMIRKVGAYMETALEQPKRVRKALSIDEKIAKMQADKKHHENKAKELGEKINSTLLSQISFELKKTANSPEEMLEILKKLKGEQKIEE